MPENQIATTKPISIEALAKMPVEQAVEVYAPNFLEALPANISLAQFKRVVLTAVNLNPDLARADRRTLLNACVKAAIDGILPDGREGALVIYNTKIKIDGKDAWINAVQFLPMIAGIRKRLRNSGEVLSADAQVVYRGDHFKHSLGDQPFIDHTPAALDVDPGDVIGAYAIIKLANGEILRDVLRKKDIEAARAVSKSKDGPMWKDFYHEAARKTALKRCAKAAPQAAELHQLLARDDEEIELPDGASLTPPPPRPQRSDFHVVEGGAAETVVEETPAVFALINLDGEEEEFDTPEKVGARMIEIAEAAAGQGTKNLDGFVESNMALLEYLRETGNTETRGRFFTRANKLRADAAAKEAAGSAKGAEGDQGYQTTPPVEQASPGPSSADSGARQAEASTVEPLPQRSDWYDSPTLTLAPRQKNGGPDWSTWVAAQFLPRVRTAVTNSDFAKLLGDNEKELGWAKEALGPLEAKRIDDEIAAQWARVPKDS